ncbi:MAG: HAMP domain-containing protein, partial [Campylobacteraceae bacterium]|nr:HAMP domain-containing protein [Campylobacteraceae bacterium]
MLRKKLNFQILFSVLLSLLLGISALYYYSSNEIKKTIDKQQLTFYTEKIDTVLHMLENKYQKLLQTQLIKSYEFTFKKSALKDIKQVHHKQVLLIHPFILNDNRDFVLHPSFNSNTFNKTDTNKIYGKIINNQEGNFYMTKNGKQRWIIFKYFTQWDWIVGYSMPTDIKYTGLKDFQNKFLLITVLIVLLISMLIILIVRYFLSPIEKLIVASQRITQGDLTSDIKINGSYELTQLSNSFSIMKNKIKEHI